MKRDALGGTWEELQKELFTPQEIAASNSRVARIGASIEARQEKELGPKRLEEAGRVKQPLAAVPGK